MIGFLYFVEGGDPGLSLTRLREMGLGYAFGASRGINAPSNGPEGLRGALVSDPRRVSPDRNFYRPDAQTWVRVPSALLAEGAPAVFVGWYTAAPPCEHVLRRERFLPGHAVKMADGSEWVAPVARQISDGGGVILPVTSRLDEEGQWVQGEVEEFYRPLWDVATALFDAIGAAEVNPSGLLVEFGDVHARAVTCLQANYAVGAVELSALGLLNQDVANNVLEASVDLPTLEAFVKKKAAADGSDSSVGAAA